MDRPTMGFETDPHRGVFQGSVELMDSPPHLRIEMMHLSVKRRIV